MTEWGDSFASRLRWARANANMTGPELAEAIRDLGGNATQSRVSEWERGAVPRTSTQLLIAEALGQPLAWLQGEEGAEPRRRHDAGTPTRAEVDALATRLSAVERWIAATDAERDRALADIQRIADQAEADDGR